MKSYESETNTKHIGVNTSTDKCTTIEVGFANSYIVSSGGRASTATDEKIIPSAGDDLTISISTDGVNFSSPSMNGSNFIELDQGSHWVMITDRATHIRVSSAQLGVGEKDTFTVTEVSEQ